jgi:hypothetical protein
MVRLRSVDEPQSSGGKAILQNSGEGSINSRPTSDRSWLRSLMKTILHGSSSAVFGWINETCCPRVNRVVSEIRHPCAFTVDVRPASSNFCVPLMPRTRIGIAMCTRCVLRISGYVDRPVGDASGSFVFAMYGPLKILRPASLGGPSRQTAPSILNESSRHSQTLSACLYVSGTMRLNAIPRMVQLFSSHHRASSSQHHFANC